MPKGKGFASRAQWKKCFALARAGKAGTWDCRKWAHETKGGKTKRYRALPGHKTATKGRKHKSKK